MPVKAVKKGDKWRVIDADTGRIAKNQGGTAIDGGGHTTRKKAIDQVRAVNRSLKLRGKI